jgi:hypothetical protein
MGGEGFLSGILLNGQDGHVDGLDDLPIPISPDTQTTPDVDVEVVPRSRSNKVTRRSKNFHWMEDEVVCSGWLNASKDPIHGANQNRNTFWGRVHAFFEKNKKTETVRTESSIMHRWLTIQHQVNKFCSCYEAIKRRHQSGHTVTDMVRIGFLMFDHICTDFIVVQISDMRLIYSMVHCTDFRSIEAVHRARQGQKEILSYALLEHTEGGRQVGSQDGRDCGTRETGKSQKESEGRKGVEAKG